MGPMPVTMRCRTETSHAQGFPRTTVYTVIAQHMLEVLLDSRDEASQALQPLQYHPDLILAAVGSAKRVYCASFASLGATLEISR